MVEGKVGFSLSVCPPTRIADWNKLGHSASLAARYLTQDWTSDRVDVCAKAGISLPGEHYLRRAIGLAQAHLLGWKKDSGELFPPGRRTRPQRLCTTLGTTQWAAQIPASKKEYIHRLGHARLGAIWNALPANIATENTEPDPSKAPKLALHSKKALQSRIPRMALKLPLSLRSAIALPEILPVQS